MSSSRGYIWRTPPDRCRDLRHPARSYLSGSGRTWPWRPSILHLALALLTLPGCHRPAADPRVEQARGEVAIRVVNRSVSDVVIELLDGGAGTRLGTAYGGNTNVFLLSWERVRGTGTLRLSGHPVGSAGVILTDRLAVRPGSMVVWTIEPVLSQSSASVF